MVKVIIGEELILEALPQELIQDLRDLLWIENEDYIKKIRLKLWLGKTPRRLNLYVRDKDTLIIPYGAKNIALNLLKEKGIPYVLDIRHTKHPVEFKLKKQLSLYDYQKDATKEVLSSDNGILVSPAGSGKTRMAMELIAKRGVKTLWLTHTLDLLRQSKRVYREFFENKAGEISGGKVSIQDITFATVQTLNNIDIEKFKDSFEMVIVDEVHRVGGTPTNLTMFYKTLSNLNAKYKYGLTATIYPKPNTATMTPIFLIGEVLKEIPIEQVPRINAEHIPIMLDTQKNDIYLNPDKTINYVDLMTYLTYNLERTNAIFETMLSVKDRHNIVLTSRNDLLEIISNMLTVHGIENRVLTGDKNKVEREKTLSDFSKGKYKFILSNYQLAKEGLDLPIADTLHLVMPMRDKRTIIQSKGRVERLYAGKTNALVFDYVDKNIGMLINMFKDRQRSMKV